MLELTGMIYIEFFERDRFMPLEIFRAMGDHGAWTDPDDSLFANLARTMRIGPHPANMAFWKCNGLERMDEWEAFFRSDEGMRDTHEQASLRTLHLKNAGCYDEVVEGPRPTEGLQYVEFFDFSSDVTDERIAEHFAGRAASQGQAILNIVVRRIGLLGPVHIGDIAVWTVPSYADGEGIFREHHDDGPLGPNQAGVYRAFGQEIL
ncbi:MAG: hypothetical protein VCB77_01105 [Alphaproteobacteria bacterium]